MYQPIQMPYLLSKSYAQYVTYNEVEIPSLSEFAITAFEAYSISDEISSIREIILMQGTIDLGFDLQEKWVGFGGLSRTDFNFPWQIPFQNFRIRLKPGAFHQLTGIPANSIIDDYIPLSQIDPSFDEDAFLELSFDEAKRFIIDYLEKLCEGKTANQYTTLFDQLIESPPNKTSELYQMLAMSDRQCQRVFQKHFGLPPKLVLSILRFQKCLDLLFRTERTTEDVLTELDYYDQAHMINDFKRNIGITPRELLELMKSDDSINS